jgi:hypothetical protein
MTAEAFGKGALRSALEWYAPHYGLDRAAIDVLTERSQVMATVDGQRICTERDRHAVVYFVADGMVTLSGVLPRRKRPIVIDVFPSGRFFCPVAPPQSGAWKDVRIVATATDGLVAFSSYDVIRAALATLSPDRQLRLIQAFFRSLSLGTYRRSLQLGLPLDGKLRLEVDYLEHRLRSRRRPGERLPRPFTHKELSDHVGASRSAVTRALRRLPSSILDMAAVPPSSDRATRKVANATKQAPIHFW